MHAKKLVSKDRAANIRSVEAGALRRGDLVLVEADDIIPADGEIIEGVASVNESAVTGESAPVLREAGGDFSSVTGGTRVLSDWIVVRVTSREGEGFLDRMIAMVEGAKRGKTPNEIALSILLAMLTLVFLLATATLAPFSQFAVDARRAGLGGHAHGAGRAAGVPDSDDDRRVAVGHRHRRHGSHGARQRDRDFRPRGRSRRRRRRAAARQDRHDHARRSPGVGVHAARRASTEQELADAAQLASLADETPEGRSIVVLAKQKFQLRGRDLAATAHTFHKFSAQTRMSGVDLEGRQLRKGAADADPQVRRGAGRRSGRRR